MFIRKYPIKSVWFNLIKVGNGNRKMMVLFFLTISVNAVMADVKPQDILKKSAVEPKGAFYKTDVPDTIDLAERAKAALNCIIGIIEPNHYYYSYCNVAWGKTVQLHPLTWNLSCEYVFSLPLLRTMCGSMQGLDIELETMRSYLSNLAQDGIIYSPAEDLGKPKGSCFPDNIGFVAFAIPNWYERDQNSKWLEYLNILCRGFDNIAIKVENRAYYPPEYCYLPDGRWLPEGRGKIKEFDGKEPASDQEGFEGAVKYYQSAPFQAFIKNYQYSSDNNSLHTAQMLKNFILKSPFWQNTTSQGYDGVENGIFGGHFHGNLIPLWALLNLAEMTNDQQLKNMVKSGFEHARKYIAFGMGWSGCYIYPGNFGSHPYPFCDGCNVADSIALAVKLTDAGLGDYWDDVEFWVRNQFAENQFLDKDKMLRYIGDSPENRKMIDRFYGGFFQTEPTNLYPRKEPLMPGCCIGSGPWGMYFAWHGITRFNKDIASVNMFLNRASEWLDIDSFLPYEGKVILHNKKAKIVSVRIPSWLEAGKIESLLNGKKVKPILSENRLIFTGLKSKDTVILRFPVKEWSAKTHIFNTEYTLQFKGNTIVDIQPRNMESGIYPTYQRDYFKKSEAPMQRIERFVISRLIPLP